MKVKVIAEIEDKDREFKVRRMNIDEIIVNYPTGTGLKSYKHDEVELISEGEIDDFLINNINFLTIKLNRGISVQFYKILFEKMFVGLVYIDFFRVRKSFIAFHPIFVIFFRLMELVPACLGLKVMGMKVTFSL